VDVLNAALHELQLVGERALSVDPWWLLVGAVLFEVQQVVRTRGWCTILRAAYPLATRLRARDVTVAYLSGAGVNAVVPARLGDVLKLWLVRRRIDDAHWPTLGATLLPETLFDVFAGTVLIVWAITAGLLSVPQTDVHLPALDLTLVTHHPFATAIALGLIALAVWLIRRSDPRRFVANLRQGLAILRQPRMYFTGVVPWQAAARAIRLLSLAASLRAFHLPVTPETVLLVMAAQGGGRIIPVGPVSAGLRVAILAYGFAAITHQPADVAAIAAYQVGAGAAQLLASVVVGAGALACALGTLSPRAALEACRHARAAHRMRHVEPLPAE
jgi:hypothetical protein